MKQTVIITGTSSGYGKAMAIEFARKGWNVIATMRSPEREKELKSTKNVFVTAMDVQYPESVRQAIDIYFICII
jgi:NAD(P)-dependent dehydrogenase (short-subunit alcohol dehydrogenase family)